MIHIGVALNSRVIPTNDKICRTGYTTTVLTVTNDSYITATEVCRMLRKISEAYAGKTIHIVLDNARYQKCSAAFFMQKHPCRY